MPCYSLIEIALGQNLDLATLEAALTRLGLAPQRVRSGTAVAFTGGVYTGGSVTFGDGRSAEAAAKAVADIRKAYTREGLATAARRQGLRVEYDKQDPAVLRITTDGRTL